MEESSIIVNYLPAFYAEQQLLEMFRRFGTIARVQVPKAEKTGDNKGYGFVVFVSINAALTAIQEMNGKPVENKLLKVSLTRETAARFQLSPLAPPVDGALLQFPVARQMLGRQNAAALTAMPHPVPQGGLRVIAFPTLVPQPHMLPIQQISSAGPLFGSNTPMYFQGSSPMSQLCIQSPGYYVTGPQPQMLVATNQRLL